MRKPLTWVLIGGLDARRRDRRRDRRRRRRSAARAAVAVLLVGDRDRLRDRRLARRRRLLRGLRRSSAASSSAAARRCRRRRRCCARATTATPSAPSPAPSPTASTAPSPSTPTRKRRATATATSETNYYRYTSAWSRSPSRVALRARALLPAQVRPARAGEVRGRLPRLQRAGQAGERALLDEKYEIFAGKDQDAIWLRQLFAPTFIVWLTESAPEKFAFELVDGTLCCYVNGHKEEGRRARRDRAPPPPPWRQRLREEALE